MPRVLRLQANMLHQRRQLTRIFPRRWRNQQRRYESNFAKDNDTTSTGHHASAGKHEPTHHGHHPEPVNESLGVGAHSNVLNCFSFPSGRQIHDQWLILGSARLLPCDRCPSAQLRHLQILPVFGWQQCRVSATMAYTDNQTLR